MGKSLTESVARLHRAGSENSQEAQKLRESTNSVLSWILEHAEGVELAFGCRMWPNGQFTHEETHFQITRGQRHTREQLLYFSKLIERGLLEELANELQREAGIYRGANKHIQRFLGAK
jgi:hypothetical protein